MKKLFSMTNRRKSDSNLIERSVNEIERDVQIVLNEMKGLEKEIRIEEKRQKRLETDWREEADRSESFDAHITHNIKLRDHLIEEIDRKSKYVESLVQSNRDLERMMDSLRSDLSRKSGEQKQQMVEFNAIKDEHKRRFESRVEAYERLDCLTSDGMESIDEYNQLMEMKNELKDIEEEIESLETQYKQLNESNRSETSVSSPPLDDYSDPIQVIINIAKLKLDSNEIQESINKELMIRYADRGLESDSIEGTEDMSQKIEIIDITGEPFEQNIEKEVENNSQIESNPTVNSNIWLNCPKSGNSSGFGLFGQQLSPELNAFGFGDQTPKRDERTVGQQNTNEFSMFSFPSNNPNTNEPNFSLFGQNDANEDKNESMNLGFNLFSNPSTDGSIISDNSPKFFNLFK